MTSDDELIAAEILMVLCFVPVAVWLLLTAGDYAWQRWIKPKMRRDRILSHVAQHSRWESIRANERVLR